MTIKCGALVSSGGNYLNCNTEKIKKGQKGVQISNFCFTDIEIIRTNKLAHIQWMLTQHSITFNPIDLITKTKFSRTTSSFFSRPKKSMNTLNAIRYLEKPFLSVLFKFELAVKKKMPVIWIKRVSHSC